MHTTEQDGLNDLLSAIPDDYSLPRISQANNDCMAPAGFNEPASSIRQGQSVQWTTSDGKIYIPTGRTVPVLEPGVYDIDQNPVVGLYFERVPMKIEGLLRFPDTVVASVLSEIKRFWESKALYLKHDLAYKRGIMLYGPPGTGKSCLIQLLTHDVVERGGVVIRFGSPSLFVEGMRRFREVQPSTPVVVTMEDMDSTISRYSETEVLNILDGIERVDHTVFVATTNYPERLGARIINRPSRFDKRFLVRYPNAASRLMYLTRIAGTSLAHTQLQEWTADTKGFSLAHLKELFSDVIIFGTPYEDSLSTLRGMSVQVSSDDNDRSVGFRASNFMYNVED